MLKGSLTPSSPVETDYPASAGSPGINDTGGYHLEYMQPGSYDTGSVVATEGPEGFDETANGKGKKGLKLRMPQIHLPQVPHPSFDFQPRESTLLKTVGWVLTGVMGVSLGGAVYTSLEIAGTDQYIATANALNSKTATKSLGSKAITASRLTEVTVRHNDQLPTLQTVLLSTTAASGAFAVAAFSAARIKGRKD
jgi:hypothetical protein